MKAILSAFARDRKGITAFIATLLAENEINILDISQTLMSGFFTMIMVLDLTDCPLSFEELSRLLQKTGAEQGMTIHIQRQDIFDAMHRI